MRQKRQKQSVEKENIIWDRCISCQIGILFSQSLGGVHPSRFLTWHMLKNWSTQKCYQKRGLRSNFERRNPRTTKNSKMYSFCSNMGCATLQEPPDNTSHSTSQTARDPGEVSLDSPPGRRHRAVRSPPRPLMSFSARTSRLLQSSTSRGRPRSSRKPKEGAEEAVVRAVVGAERRGGPEVEKDAPEVFF